MGFLLASNQELRVTHTKILYLELNCILTGIFALIGNPLVAAGKIIRRSGQPKAQRLCLTGAGLAPSSRRRPFCFLKRLVQGALQDLFFSNVDEMYIMMGQVYID
jgi:hypothetical protein